jgi:hypothetical protein
MFSAIDHERLAHRRHFTPDPFTLAPMTTTRLSHSVRTRGISGLRGWSWVLVVLGISALLHLIVIAWLGDTLHMPLPAAQKPEVVLATLHTLPPPAPKPIVRPVRPALRKPKPQPVPPPSATPMPATQTASATPSIAANDNVPTNADTDADSRDVADQAATAAPSAPAEHRNDMHYKIDLPPSAALEYDVQKTAKDGQPMYGHGNIRWQTDGARYTVDGDAGVLFFTVLHFRSEGAIDNYGVSPEIYSEKRLRKSETATHFHRQRNTISFSASTKSYPRQGGEQDRASVIWQLAAIGRGDSTHFTRGATIDLAVAGTRDLDTWRMVVVGEEAIDVAGETIAAWHVTRTPRQGSYDQKLDIWLAPGKEWYPVRLRYTEINGDYLEMSLSKLNALPSDH